MASLEEVLSDLDKSEYLQDDIQYIIDENLRTIAIPEDGVVLGVVGDKKVNRVNFQMPRFYNGFDMSLFKYRINYKNANGDLNFYAVEDVTILDDMIYFTWLVDRTAAAYIGKVSFVVRLYKTEGTNITQNFYTTYNTANVLEGLFVDEELEDAEDVTLHLQRILEEYAYEIAAPVLNSYLIDHELAPGATAEQIQRFKDLESRLDSRIDSMFSKFGETTSYKIMGKAFTSTQESTVFKGETTIDNTTVRLADMIDGGNYDILPLITEGTISESIIAVLENDEKFGSYGLNIQKKGLYYVEIFTKATYATHGEVSTLPIGYIWPMINGVSVDSGEKHTPIYYDYNKFEFLISLDKDDFLTFAIQDGTPTKMEFSNTCMNVYALDWENKVPDVSKEIIDSRIGVDGTTYDSLGTAIREQVKNATGLEMIDSKNTKKRVPTNIYLVKTKSNDYFGEFNSNNDYDTGDIVHTIPEDYNIVQYSVMTTANKDKVPIDNLVAKASSQFSSSSYHPYEAIDQNITSEWSTSTPPSSEEWFEVTYDPQTSEKVRVEKFAIAWDYFFAKKFLFQYSDDGKTWNNAIPADKQSTRVNGVSYFTTPNTSEINAIGYGYLLKEPVTSKRFRILVEKDDMSSGDIGIRIKEFALFKNARVYYKFTKDFFGTGTEELTDYAEEYNIPTNFNYEVGSISYQIENHKGDVIIPSIENYKNLGEVINANIENLKETAAYCIDKMNKIANANVDNLNTVANTNVDNLNTVTNTNIGNLNTVTDTNIGNLNTATNNNISNLNAVANNGINSINNVKTTAIDDVVRNANNQITAINNTSNSLMNSMNTAANQHMTNINTEANSKIEEIKQIQGILSIEDGMLCVKYESEVE